MTYDYTYTKRWRYERAHGHTRLGDPSQVREHITALLDAGASNRAIAECSGVSATTISKIRRGQAHVRRDVAARILTVTPTAVLPRTNPDGFVPNIGARRRIYALHAIGHTAAQIAAAAGMPTYRVQSLKNQAGDWITRAAHERIVSAYQQLANTPGTSKHCRTRAAKYGWAPPAAWDDDQIDDPAARPTGTATDTDRASLTRAELVTEVEFLLTHVDRAATIYQVAERLGYADRSGVQAGLRRAGRTDLLDTLNRNSLAATGRPGGTRKDTAA